MAHRRNQEIDTATDIIRLAALIVVGIACLAGFLVTLHNVTLFVLGVFALCVVGVVVIRRTIQSRSISNTSIITHHVAALSDVPARERKPADLMQHIRVIDWFQFEKLIAHLYEKGGYKVNRRGGANPDGGIDLIIEKNGERAAVQCKQWRTWNVGVKPVREFLGALKDQGFAKGIFITLRGYTADAKLLAEKHGIQIVNEAQLAQLLRGAAAQSDLEVMAILQDTGKFCPKCEREMVLRIGKKGRGAGKRFWGCSAFPYCRFTLPA